MDQAVALAAIAVRKRKERERQRNQWVDDPVGFITKRLKASIWSRQREIVESVRDNRHTHVRSCHGTGKSYIAARAAAWWLEAHEPGEAFVLSSAPSWPQVRAILWREINRAHRAGKLRGTTNQTEWWIDGEIVAMGRKPADYDEDAFQGIHAPYVLVILDEACGIPPQLWNAAETVTTNEACRVLAIGNPDTPNSEFKRKMDSDLWHTIRIDAFDTPNFTGEVISDNPETDAKIKAQLIDQLWVEERRQEWGEDSNLWASKVRGEFPLVPVGQVYKELSPSQQWFGKLPTFTKLVGGLDFGGQNDQAHKTAGVVAGVAMDDSLIEFPIPRISPYGAKGVLIRLANFEHSGPYVHDQLWQWMHDVERLYGRRVEWKASKEQSGWISSAVRNSFHVTANDATAGSVDAGIGLQRRRMGMGSSFFTEDLTRVPRFLADDPDERWYAGEEMDARPWYERMTNLRWKQQPDEDKQVPGIPIKRDDDTTDADRYLHEAVDELPGNTGPAIAKTTLSGKERRRVVV